MCTHSMVCSRSRQCVIEVNSLEAGLQSRKFKRQAERESKDKPRRLSHCLVYFFFFSSSSSFSSLPLPKPSRVELYLT